MNNNHKQKAICILGMHRSGTSAIARAFNLLGVYLGEEQHLMSPSPDNPEGYWERTDLYELHEELLSAIKLSWDTCMPLEEMWQNAPEIRTFREKLLDLIQRNFSDIPLWGWKDPRSAIFINLWQEILDELGIELVVVFVVRNPLDVARSLQKRDGFPYDKGFGIWFNYNITALRAISKIPTVFISYENFLANWEPELRRCSSVLNISWPPEDSDLRAKMNSFIRPDLCHSCSATADLIEAGAPQPIRKLYELLLPLLDGHIDVSTASETLNILYGEFLSYARFFQTDTAKLWETRKLVTSVQREIFNRDSLLTEKDRNLAEKDGLLAEKDRLLAEKDRLLAERYQQIASLNQAVRERNQLIEESKIILAQRDKDINELFMYIDGMRATWSWRITAPLRFIASSMGKVTGSIALLRRIFQVGNGLFPTIYKATRIFLRKGWPGVREQIIAVRTRSGSLAATSFDSSPAVAFNKSRQFVVPYYIDPKEDENDGVINSNVSVAIHIHLFYPEMLDEFVSRLKSLKHPFDIYVSISQAGDTKKIHAAIKASLTQVGKVVVETVPNKGRDIAPLIIQFGKRLARYDIIGHFHTKKSSRPGLNNWCSDILDLLLGAPDNSGGRIAHILGLLQDDAKIVYPEGNLKILKDPTGWADNREMARKILEKYSTISIDDFPVIEFSEGSMFWARAECLHDYLTLPLFYDYFPAEPIPDDGTLAHALERLLFVFSSRPKGRFYRIHNGDSIDDYRHYEEQREYSSLVLHRDIRVLSYYLPQFHPIPENDLWHGEGFTEWTKVKAATPLFEDHYQQHIPHHDIGYYLLDTPDTLRKQADLMRKAGVFGQVFYHYWFSGKLILGEPARMLLEATDIDMPFCFCWANENWTRKWDGNEDEILLRQDYSDDDARAFINYLIPFFRDPRYIRVENRPVLFVYRPSSFPDAREYVRIWAEECVNNNIPRPYIVAVLTRGASSPNNFDMDAGVERVLNDWTAGVVPDIKPLLKTYRELKGSVLSYDEVATFYEGQTDKKGFTYFRSLVPMWDNTARYGTEALLVHGSTPQRFQTWLENIIGYTKRSLPEDRRFVLINAWNEWAEGAHLEPDSRFGYSYLNSIGRALSAIPYGDLNPDYAIPSGLHVRLSLPDVLRAQLRLDPELNDRFLACLSHSTFLAKCSVSTDASDLLGILPGVVAEGHEEADFILQFRRVSFFDPAAIEKMVQTACHCPRAVVISNGYDRLISLAEVTENGSVHSRTAHTAPIVLYPAKTSSEGHKNYRMRTDAHCFATRPSSQTLKERPAVTTIIRFHKSASLTSLKNALYCLSAMEDCVVAPLIAAQDLSELQQEELKNVLAAIPFPEGMKPAVHHYSTPDGKGDLRSTMLNESLRQVKTRYAAFLDYDDLLMSHAYSYLIGRLIKTGKAISFGRVYLTIYNAETGLFIERRRTYEAGYSYDEFLLLNHAPIHSFMLDLEQLDIANTVYYEDQRFMEDYLLMLQITTRDNADWEGLKENVYIGDYIHSLNRAHTLAITNETERQELLKSPEYLRCEKLIHELRCSKDQQV